MSATFDPYYTWLAIPPEEQPPDYYRLLALRKYEANGDVISNAADQRMAHLRSFQNGKHSELSQKILNEVSTARVTLLVAEKKQAYDEALRRREQKATAPAKPLPKARPLDETLVDPLVATIVEQPKTTPKPAARTPYVPAPATAPTQHKAGVNPLIFVAIGGAALLLMMVLGGAALWLLSGSDPKKPLIVNNPGIPAPKPPGPAPRPVPSPQPGPAPRPGPDQPKPPGPDIKPAPGAAQFAARTTRDHHIEILNSAELTRLGSEFTAECWVRWKVDNGGQRLMGNWPHHGQGSDQNTGWQFSLFGPSIGVVHHGTGPAGGNNQSGNGNFPNDGQWHHLAYVGDKQGFVIFCDGKQMLSKMIPAVPPAPRTTNLYLGSADTPQADESLYRDFASFRLSKGLRYREKFVPPAELEKDASTVALLDFRKEQTAGVVSDRSGQGHDGKLVGVTWVEVKPGGAPGNATVAKAVAIDKEVNLLELVDQTDGSRGRSNLEKGKKLTTTLDMPVIAPINVDLPESYILEATVTRRGGDDMFGIALTIGGQQTMLEIDSFHSQTSGLDMIEGRRANQPGYPNPFKGQLLKVDRPVKLRITVGKDSLQAHADGEQFFAWQGNPQTVSLFGIFRSRAKPGLSIVSWEGAFDITDFKLLPHDGSKVEVATNNSPPMIVPVGPPTIPMLTPGPMVVPVGPSVTPPGEAFAKEPQYTPPVITPAKETNKLPAAPDAAAQKKAVEELRKVLKDDYADVKKPEDKAALSTKLAKLARDTTDDVNTQFALYSEATRLAVEGARLAPALALIDEQGRKFDVDIAAFKTDAIKTVAPLAKTPADKKQVAETALFLANEAVDANQFEVAGPLMRVAVAAASKANDPALRTLLAQRNKQIDEIEAQWKLAQQAKDRLVSEPDNAKANLVYGKYLCLIAHDWEQGLPYLAKADHASLLAVVQEEATPPTDAEKQLAVADQWWTLGQAATADEKSQMLARAYYWYRVAQPRLVGLNNAKATKRRDDLKELLSAEALQQGSKRKQSTSKTKVTQRGGVIDMLPLIDPRADAQKGEWRMVDGVLVCDTQHFVPKMYLPYIPPEEYDVKVVWSQVTIRHDVSIILPRDGKSFAWMLGGTTGIFHFSHDPRSVLSNGGREPTRSDFPGLFQPRQRYTTIVQVRKDGVKAFFEGRLAASYKTDYRDLVVDSWRALPDPARMAVGCDDPTFFHVIEVTEVTGEGKLLRTPK